jgi:hypothetical protein
MSLATVDMYVLFEEIVKKCVRVRDGREEEEARRTHEWSTP